MSEMELKEEDFMSGKSLKRKESQNIEHLIVLLLTDWSLKTLRGERRLRYN